MNAATSRLPYGELIFEADVERPEGRAELRANSTGFPLGHLRWFLARRAPRLFALVLRRD